MKKFLLLLILLLLPFAFAQPPVLRVGSVTIPNNYYPANQTIFGCGVEYISGGLSFTVGAPCNYSIGGVAYRISSSASITLAAADMTNPRIDVIGVDNTAATFTLTGTPAGAPQQPTVDPSTQLALTFVYIPAASTTPQGIVATMIYDENTEWTCTPSAHFACASTSNPYHLTKDIEATTAVLGNNFTLVKPAAGTVDLSTQNNLTFYIRSKATWPTANNTGSSGLRTLSLFWLNGSTQVGNQVVIRDGTFGFSTSNTTSYQQIQIPVSLFGAGSNAVTTLKGQITGNGGASSIGFYIDEVTLQSGSNVFVLPSTLMNFRGTWNSTSSYLLNDVVVSNGIAYVALVANTNVGVTTATTWGTLAPTNSRIRSFGAAFDGSGSALTSGAAQTTYLTIPFACTISAWNITVDAGTITFDIWKIATGTAIPTVANTITAAALPAISSGTAVHSTTLTGWTTSVAANDIVGININTVATATKASLVVQCNVI